MSGAGAAGTFYEAVSQFSISSLFLSSLGSFQRAVARARGGRGGWLTYPPMHTVSAGKTQCVRAIPEGGGERPLGEVGRGTQGNGETINAENPERSLCPSVIFSDWRRESSLCDISSPFLLACASVLLERQESKGGGGFSDAAKITLLQRECVGEQLSSSPSFGKFLSPFLQPPKANAKATFRDLSASPPLRRRGGNALRPHRCNARVPEGGGGLNLSGILHF